MQCNMSERLIRAAIDVLRIVLLGLLIFCQARLKSSELSVPRACGSQSQDRCLKSMARRQSNPGTLIIVTA